MKCGNPCESRRSRIGGDFFMRVGFSMTHGRSVDSSQSADCHHAGAVMPDGHRSVPVPGQRVTYNGTALNGLHAASGAVKKCTRRVPDKAPRSQLFPAQARTSEASKPGWFRAAIGAHPSRGESRRPRSKPAGHPLGLEVTNDCCSWGGDVRRRKCSRSNRVG